MSLQTWTGRPATGWLLKMRRRAVRAVAHIQTAKPSQLERAPTCVEAADGLVFETVRRRLLLSRKMNASGTSFVYMAFLDQRKAKPLKFLSLIDCEKKMSRSEVSRIVAALVCLSAVHGTTVAQSKDARLMSALDNLREPLQYCNQMSVRLYGELRAENSPLLRQLMPELPMCFIDPSVGWNSRRTTLDSFDNFISDIEQHFGVQSGVDATLFVNEILRPLFEGIQDQKRGELFDYPRCVVLVENAIKYAETKSYGSMYVPTLRRMHARFLNFAAIDSHRKR